MPQKMSISLALLFLILLAACQSREGQLRQIFETAIQEDASEDAEKGFLDAIVTKVHENQKLLPLFEDGQYRDCLPAGISEKVPDLSRIVPIAASWERGEDGYYRYPISCDDAAWSKLKSGEAEYLLTIPAYVREDLSEEELMLLLMSCPEQFAWSEISSVSAREYVKMAAETSAAWKEIYDADAINRYAKEQDLTAESARNYDFPGCEGRALTNIQKNFSAYLRDSEE